MVSTLIASLILVQPSVPWSVDQSGAMNWQGQPYIPIGIRIPGTPEAIETAVQSGVKELLVELPADGRTWPTAIAALEKAGARYLLEINSAAPTTTGVTVEPESYRITGINQRTRIQATLPGTKEALVLLVSGDGAIQRSQRVTADAAGKVDTEVDPGNTVEHVALIYPLGSESRVPDGWDGIDEHRDRVLNAVEGAGPMTGLRGLVNPLGSVQKFPDADLRFVPTSGRFKLELEVYLRRKYTTQRRAEQAWSIQAPDFNSFAEIAALVPLWSPKRGVSGYWDPTRNRTYSIISRNNQAWADIQTVFNTALRRRMINLTQSLQQRLGVPVVQTWAGWNGPYEGNAAGLTGLAVRLQDDSMTSLISGGAKAASTLSRWNKSGLLFATDVRLRADDGDYAALPDLVEQSATMGMRGWFFNVAESGAAAKKVAELAENYRLKADWGRTRPTFLNFPESAQNPAVPMLLGGQTWWVPAPLEGNRIDYGRRVSGYRMRTADGDQTVLWANRDPIKLKLRFLEPKSVSVRTAGGAPVATKVTKSHVELTLGTEPILVLGPDIPVPQEVVDETLVEFSSLASSVPKQVQNLVDDIESFRQMSTTITQNPSGAFLGMRARLERLRRSLAPIVWVEAENSRDHTFSEVVTDASASGLTALSLTTRINPLEGFFKARYLFNPRLPGSHDIWVAMSGQNAAAERVGVWINDESLEKPEGASVSQYGGTYGWRKMGSVNVTMSQVSLDLRVGAPLLGPLSVDAIVLAPAGYQPSGPFLNWFPPVSIAPRDR